MIFTVIRYYQAIPPGMEFSHIVPHDVDLDGEEGNEDGSGSLDPPIWADVSFSILFSLRICRNKFAYVPLRSLARFTYCSV